MFTIPLTFSTALQQSVSKYVGLTWMTNQVPMKRLTSPGEGGGRGGRVSDALQCGFPAAVMGISSCFNCYCYCSCMFRKILRGGLWDTSRSRSDPHPGS